MKRHFNTQKVAERFLKKQRKVAYKDIEKKGWRIIDDKSFVYESFIWKTEKKKWVDTIIGKMFTASGYKDESNVEICESRQTNIKKWFTFLVIVTDEMIKDLKNFKPIDVQKIESELMADLQNNISKNITKRLFDLGSNSNSNK